jgi:phosphoheptose isomerase
LVAQQDVLVALSTGGASRNVVRGAEAGRTRGAFLVALTGETGGTLAGKVDLLLNVPRAIFSASRKPISPAVTSPAL